FVENLKENNAAGVVVNIGPYITNIMPQIIVFCEQNNFPLFIIPWKTRIIDLSYEFCRRIINDEKTQQTLTEAFKNLIINPDAKDDYANTLERTGFGADANYTVVTLVAMEGGQNITGKFVKDHDRQITKRLWLNAQNKGAFLWNRNLVLIYQDVTREQVTAMVHDIGAMAEESVIVHSGISQQQIGTYAIATLYKQSQWSLMVAEMGEKTAICYEDLGIEKILLQVADRQVLQQYHNQVLGKLAAYDQSNHSDYYDTLRIYCRYNGSVLEIAKLRNIHRNTVNLKIKKIKEILDMELNYETIMNCMICFHIYDILNHNKS
ncbi:MAG: helix-turn-helix domain-containing protein, partial [Eubacteriales bacterium]